MEIDEFTIELKYLDILQNTQSNKKQAMVAILKHYLGQVKNNSSYPHMYVRELSRS